MMVGEFHSTRSMQPGGTKQRGSLDEKTYEYQLHEMAATSKSGLPMQQTADMHIGRLRGSGPQSPPRGDLILPHPLSLKL